MDSSASQLFHSVCLVLLLSWVKGTDVDNCKFGNETDDGEGYFRLFPGEPQGRVEVRCGIKKPWGTISCKGTKNIEIAASLICRKLGYGDGSPVSSSEEGPGYGPVWNVTCEEQHEDIENCFFTPTEGKKVDDAPPTYTFSYWEHDDDLHVKCGKRTTLDDVGSPPENILMFILVDVATFVVLLGLIILSGFVVYKLLIRKFKSARNT